MFRQDPDLSDLTKSLTITLRESQIRAIDEIVETSPYYNRSSLIREAVNEFLETYRKEQNGKKV